MLKTTQEILQLEAKKKKEDEFVTEVRKLSVKKIKAQE